MTAQEYFDIALQHHIRGNFIEAIRYFSLAESSSMNSVFILASYTKGLILANTGKRQEAIASFEKAEKDAGPIGYPDASYDKGCSLEILGELVRALEAYSKAESDSGKKGYPAASNNKGVILYNNKMFSEALFAFEKAENDSGIKGYPMASYNKGILFKDMDKKIDALLAFEKAENDSGFVGYPKASFNKGTLLTLMDKIDEALLAFEKAENDSGKNGFPDASYKKGCLLIDLKRFEEAIEAFEKAENDGGINGHFEASTNKGVIFHNQGKIEEALIAFEKAELDAGPKGYPNASFGKGNILGDLDKIIEAILAYQKAEIDGGKFGFPMASNNRGILIFKHLYKQTAIHAYHKGINEFKNNIDFYDSNLEVLLSLYVNCCKYYLLFYEPQTIRIFIKLFFEEINRIESYNIYSNAISEMYLIQGKLGLKENSKLASKDDFLKALSYNDKCTEAIDLLIQEFDDDKTYRSRKDYLDFLLIREIIKEKNYRKNAFAVLKVSDLFHHSDDKMLQYIELLIHEEDVLKKGDKALRLREAYLLAASSEYWHIVFYIIDNLLDDGDYSLDQLDQYFYVLSASYIGEPKSSLQSISDSLIFDVNIAPKNEYLCEVQISIKLSKSMGKTKLERNMISSILNKQPIDITMPESHISKILTTAYFPITYDETIEENRHLKSFRRELNVREPNFNDLAEYIDEIITSRDKHILASVLKLIREKMTTQKEVKEYHLLMAYALWVYVGLRKESQYEEVVKEEIRAAYLEGILNSVLGFIVTVSVFVNLVVAMVVNICIRKYKEYKGFKKLTWEEFIA